MEKMIYKIVIILLLIFIIGCNKEGDNKIRRQEEKIYAIDITKENAPFIHIFAYNRGNVIYANINKKALPLKFS